VECAKSESNILNFMTNEKLKNKPASEEVKNGRTDAFFDPQV